MEAIESSHNIKAMTGTLKKKSTREVGINPFAKRKQWQNEDADDDAGDADSQRTLLDHPHVSPSSPSRSRRTSPSFQKYIQLTVALLVGVVLGVIGFSRIVSPSVAEFPSVKNAAHENAVAAVGETRKTVITRVKDDAFQLRIMTFNLRYGTAKDGPNSWPFRRAHAADIINRYGPVIFGTQEGLEQQLTELKGMLARPYERFGEAREKNGEHVQIFYDTTVVERVAGGTFWLSKTPDIPESKSWDAACKRVATWCRFRLLATGQEFYHVNTHLDNEGKIARYEGAKVIWNEMQKQISKHDTTAAAASLPLFMTGDFNTFRPSDVYQYLTTDDGGPLLQDAWQSAAHQIGNISCTFHEFIGPKYDETEHKDWNDPSMDLQNHFAANHIDFILSRPALPVLSTEVITEAWDGRYPSDHYPVIATILFPSPAQLPPVV